MASADRFKEEIKNKKTSEVQKSAEGLSTGSTLLNLACSGKANVGFYKGKYYFIVGDSASGKTFLSLTCLAEAARNPNFDSYRFIFDNAEGGALMDIEQFFGSKVKNRLEPPARNNDGDAIHSTQVEEFYFFLDEAIEEGKPFVYILDSMDLLSSKSEEKKFTEHKKAFVKKNKNPEVAQQEVSGSYGDGKAKINSANLRRIIPKLEKTGSILIIINQTRDSVGGFTLDKKTRSGGHALKFYATLEMWSSSKGRIKRAAKGKQWSIGINVQIKVKKNRQTGREPSVTIPIYYSTGIDDLGSCVDFLIEQKHWNKTGSSVTAKEFNYKGQVEPLIKYIEDNNLEKDLKRLVTQVWEEIEASLEVKRKRKYD